MKTTAIENDNINISMEEMNFPFFGGFVINEKEVISNYKMVVDVNDEENDN